MANMTCDIHLINFPFWVYCIFWFLFSSLIDNSLVFLSFPCCELKVINPVVFDQSPNKFFGGFVSFIYLLSFFIIGICYEDPLSVPFFLFIFFIFALQFWGFTVLVLVRTTMLDDQLGLGVFGNCTRISNTFKWLFIFYF